MPIALVADDAADVRALVGAVLRPRGYDIVEAVDGIEVLALLAEDPLPGVILLDVQMPELDGWSALEAIRGDPRTADLPVVLCTVRSSDADRDRGRMLGCDAFVTKPFAVAELAAAVALACEGDPDTARRPAPGQNRDGER